MLALVRRVVFTPEKLKGKSQLEVTSSSCSSKTITTTSFVVEAGESTVSSHVEPRRCLGRLDVGPLDQHGGRCLLGPHARDLCVPLLDPALKAHALGDGFPERLLPRLAAHGDHHGALGEG